MFHNIPTYVIAGPALLGVVGLIIFIIASLQRDTLTRYEVPVATVAQLMHLIRRHSGDATTVDGYYDMTVADVEAAQPRRDDIEVIDHRSPRPLPFGRHAVDNPARSVVHPSWMPAVGGSRIALLLEHTMEIPVLLPPQWAAHYAVTTVIT